MCAFSTALFLLLSTMPRGVLYFQHTTGRPNVCLGLGLGLGLGLEEVFVFDIKSENRDRAVEAVESVSEAR